MTIDLYSIKIVTLPMVFITLGLSPIQKQQSSNKFIRSSSLLERGADSKQNIWS